MISISLSLPGCKLGPARLDCPLIMIPCIPYVFKWERQGRLTNIDGCVASRARDGGVAVICNVVKDVGKGGVVGQGRQLAVAGIAHVDPADGEVAAVGCTGLVELATVQSSAGHVVGLCCLEAEWQTFSPCLSPHQ